MKDATPSSVIGRGSPDADLCEDQLQTIVADAVSGIPAGSRVLAIVPDSTRDDNTGILFPAALETLERNGISTFDAMVAQGTHPPMSAGEKLAKIGTRDFRGNLFDHKWDDPAELVTIGELPVEQVRSITNGILDEAIELTVNRLLSPGAYDVVLIFGATVPHEVAGFAGGAKYFFPGVAGPELTHKTHWLAALAGIENIIGRIETPTRHLIEAAAERISAEVIAFTSVCTRDDADRLRTHALFAGDFRSSLRKAAEISRIVHIKYTGRKYKRVVAPLDEHYKDLWVGGKASYKLGGVIEEGGELVIYAPHLTCISETHGAAIERFGGYFPIEKIKQLVAASGEVQGNLCVAAHLAHVAFAGQASNALEPRYRITLASQIDEAVCSRVNLGYRDPNGFSFVEFENDSDTLIVERAGRDLYLVSPDQAFNPLPFD